jgi:hypothetical protein
MSFGSSQEHRFLARVLPWLAIGDFHQYKCFMPAAYVDSNLQWSIPAETIQHTASHLSFSQSTKHESQSSPSTLAWQNVNQVTSVACAIAAYVPYSSLSSKNSGRMFPLLSNTYQECLFVLTFNLADSLLRRA